jgi:protein phosphatase 2C family protein 2/3
MKDQSTDPARSFRKRRLTLPGKLLQDDADTAAAALSTIYDDKDSEDEQAVVTTNARSSCDENKNDRILPVAQVASKTTTTDDVSDSSQQEQPVMKKQRREEMGNDKPSSESATKTTISKNAATIVATADHQSRQSIVKKDSSSSSSTSSCHVTTGAEKKKNAKSMTHMHMTQAFICRIRSRLLLNKVATKSNHLSVAGTNGRRQLHSYKKGGGSAVASETAADENQQQKDIVFKHDHLPFPKDVVGTFSCHGIEPLYGLYYDEDDSEDVIASPPSVEEDDKEAAAAAAAPRTTPVAEKINQDRGGVAYPYANNWSTALFATYDGHGEMGELVSHYAMTEIQKRLERHPNFDSNIEKALIETFVQVDEDLEEQEHIEPLYSGTTACVVIMRRNTLYIANAGDSRAVLARKKAPHSSIPTNEGPPYYTVVNLSVDQNPDSPGEKERIESCGGFVSLPPEPGLSARVWLDSDFTHIGLAMARSIGDHALKPVGVISEPVVTKHDITDQDEFIIIATDGVWVSRSIDCRSVRFDTHFLLFCRNKNFIFFLAASPPVNYKTQIYCNRSL